MIKILTLLGNNYGGCLQTYALQKKINDLGYETEQINYTEYLSKKVSIKTLIKKIVYFNRNRKFKKFKDKKLNIGEKILTLEDDKSKYIVGSDQIWNPQIPFDIRKNFFLSFVNEKNRKYSYAASIGTDYMDTTDENLKQIEKYLSDFNIITVREKTAKDVINKFSNVKVETVLDPTLLLTSDEWKKETTKYLENDYMLVYTLGLNNKNNSYIDSFSKRKNLKIVDIYYKKRFNNTLKKENNFGPTEFISSIKNSKFVVTNSFHGTVFSILFHKEFISITRGNMNSRIYDLLKSLGLEDRIIDEKDLDKLDINLKKIDYKNVDEILNIERKKSISILKLMLK